MGMDKQYRLMKVKSTVYCTDQAFSLQTADELAAFISSNLTGSGFCVAYLDYQVLIGRYIRQNEKREIGGKMLFYCNQQIEPRFLQRLRVFNQDSELFIWRGYDGFRWRLRIDGNPGGAQEGEAVEVVEVEQLLWGTRAESNGEGWIKIYEDRGTEIILPGENLNVDMYNRVKLLTRNYIEYNDLGQAGYADCRFVKFIWGGETH